MGDRNIQACIEDFYNGGEGIRGWRDQRLPSEARRRKAGLGVGRAV